MVLKSEIVHDLQQHIERLNRDLEAARDTSGTGFYVSKDTYEELTTKERASREAVEEWKQRIALWEEEVQRTNEKHRATVEELQTTRRELGETSDALSASRVQLDLVQADLQRQTLLTRAHAHHERRLDATAHVLQSSLQLSTGDVQQLHARVSRMRDREQRNMSAAAKISELVGAEVERAQGAVGTYNEGAARQTQQLLHTLQSRVGPEFEAELGSRLREHAEALGADVARVLEAAAAQRDEGKGGCESAGSRVNELAAGLCASITGARMQGSEACAKLESHVTAQTAEQTVALGSMATAIRAILTSCSSSTAELLAHSQQRAQQVIDELRREADALRARHAEEIRILREQAQQLNKQARQEDDKLIDAVRSMIEERRAREEAAVGGLVDSAGTQADAHAQSSVRLIEQSGAICEALDHAASAVRSDIDKSSQGVESQLSACQSVHTGVVGSLGAAVSDHAEVIGAQLAAASEAASTAQSALGAAVQQSQQFVTSLNESSASSLDRVAQLASASLDAAQATSSKATGEWRAARTELDSLARTQASERDVFAGELGRGISSISTVVQRETSSGIQATQSSGSTPSANRRYRSIDSWNITRPHDEILDRLAGNGNDGPSFVDAESVEWTGMPTEHMDVECDKEESSKSMVVLSSSPIRPAFSSPIRPDSSLLRKRPSENAVSPASDPSMERPTRRPRTRQTIDGSTEHDGEESAIPIAATYAYPSKPAHTGLN
ncbi:hypothetical protein GGF43_003655 [Coemansia sp. RSA 2618]|nr:hypothetical protein GGF43_003655 [Coemansia sp. RSA 2618]